MKAKEPKKILITGSLGYLGSVLTNYLQAHGRQCLGYDTGFFQDGQLYPASDPPTIIADMRDFKEQYLEGVDAVIHLAAMSNDPFGNLDVRRIYDPTRHYAVRLAMFCKERGIKFIFPSSCSVYGKGIERLLDENSPTFPQTPYSLNKLQIEQDLERMSDGSFCPIILRLATVFGLSPRMRFDLVINMLVAMAVVEGKIILNSDGKAWRPHVHIQDVCKAFYLAIHYDHHGEKPLILNVGDEQNNFQISTIAQMTKELLRDSEIVYLQKEQNNLSGNDWELIKDRKIQDGVDERTYRVSFNLVKQIFPGFSCDWSVQDGMAHMIQELRRLSLTEQQLKSIDYYRLQKIEYLYQNHYIDEELRWTRERENTSLSAAF